MGVIDIKKIVFVCSGNTCRSPMAEAIFNYYAKGSDFYAESAGVVANDGEPVAGNSAITIKSLIGEDISAKTARSLMLEDIQESHLLLTMTGGQKVIIKSLAPADTDNVFTLGEKAGFGDEEVFDPYMQDKETYMNCAKQIEKFVKIIIKELGCDDNSSK